MNNGYERASQYQLFLCAYPHGKRVMPLACERVITCRVRAFTLFPEIPWRVTYSQPATDCRLMAGKLSLGLFSPSSIFFDDNAFVRNFTL